ncbi:GPP34 family phosphoprotein [Paractinoplanes durhamensis]|uniref:Caspase domain-containing protein n=1 Tax=Paractinoplanes durhamensis TaxID=113563 RepID=A0ABQ3Z8N3_9ACTN|nr:GPP34 family phosphoprotein [Actinoplanes durhamensis]GIE06187.1 hypothetical protein Adu01nite_75370 [Actinoplanes durhamensis]
MQRYRALLAGNWQYGADSLNLPDLKGPLNDISRMAAALSDQEIGMFAWRDIRTLPERASHEILYAAESFFQGASYDEVLFFYYSGHCLADEDGALLLCGNNSTLARKRSTTVPLDAVIRLVDDCAASAVVIAVDGKYTGAEAAEQFVSQARGKRRLVLLGMSGGERIQDEPQEMGLSLFTSYLVRGMRGDAAQPGAARVTFADLCHYVQLRLQDPADSVAFSYDEDQARMQLARALTAPRADSESDDRLELGGPASTLTVSEALLELGEVEPDEVLPVEVIYVSARTLAGYPAQWRARTSAKWVGLGRFPDRLEITLRPAADETRANIEIRNEETGATRTVRISARLRQQRMPPAAYGPVRAVVPMTADLPSPWHDLGFEQQQRLIDGLLALSGMRDGDLRSFYVQELEAKIGRPLHLERHAEARHDVWSIVRACLDRPGTLGLLARMLTVFHGDTGATRELIRLVDSFDVGSEQPEPGPPAASAGFRLADEYFLLSHGPDGQPVVNRAIIGAGLAGAVVGELMLLGRLEAANGAVRRVPGSEFGEPAYRAVGSALDNSARPGDLLDLINRLRRDIPPWISQRLVDQRVLRPETNRGLFGRRSVRYPVVDPARASEPMTRMMRMIIDPDAGPDRQSAMLAALMTVTGLHSVLVEDGNRARVEERLGQVALDGDFGEVASAVDRSIALITYGPTRR